VALFLFSGCSKPNAANIELRKQNQQLAAQIEELKRQHEADLARVRTLESQQESLPTLPQERLDKLFTVHGIRFGKLTGGYDSDPKNPGDEVVKVYVVPFDTQGDVLKAAGRITAEVFDLSESDKPLVARCESSLEDAPKNWYGKALLYEYVLTCPLDRTPRGADLTVRVTFMDELTQRTFVEQKQIKINLPVVSADGRTQTR
jgi:hypothetical protein